MKDWRTTLSGLLLGLVPALDALQSILKSGQPIHWQSLTTALGAILFGVYAADAKKKAQTNATNQ